jgi:RHH-type proline utilization regulon transcriptional repressor/proline dehydrogenase/delta 1-pyrroline-5-carboxylate dehydrogenase
VHTDAEELPTLIQGKSQVHFRAFQPLHQELLVGIKNQLGSLTIATASSNGRVELIHFIREVAISADYHRYGNSIDREREVREKLS